jgi:hypothetical protein
LSDSDDSLQRLLAQLDARAQELAAHGIPPALADCGACKGLGRALGGGTCLLSIRSSAVLAATVAAMCAHGYRLLLPRAGLCTPRRGTQIGLNLARLEDWAVRAHFDEGEPRHQWAPRAPHGLMSVARSGGDSADKRFGPCGQAAALAHHLGGRRRQRPGDLVRATTPRVRGWVYTFYEEGGPGRGGMHACAKVAV